MEKKPFITLEQAKDIIKDEGNKNDIDDIPNQIQRSAKEHVTTVQAGENLTNKISESSKHSVIPLSCPFS